MNIQETYLRDISRYQPLTKEQELTLVTRARQGDADARNQLIHANLRMVVNIARQYQQPGVEMLDLIQEGNIGLIYAVDKFDPTLGCRFSTFAVFWIKKYIFLYLDKNFDDNISLDMEIIKDCELIHLSDTIEDQSTCLGSSSVEHVEKKIEREELQKKQELLANKLECLSEREQEVLRLLYGIGLGSSLSVTEVSLLLNISKARVCQLRDRALGTLRNKLETTD
jgi:RNA polymerase primary sigma factor